MIIKIFLEFQHFCFVINHNALTLFHILADMIFNLLDLILFAILLCKCVVLINELMYVAIEDYMVYIAIIMNHNLYVYYTMFKFSEKCTKKLIGHSRVAFNNHESNIGC